jgi:hypothetical protein
MGVLLARKSPVRVSLPRFHFRVGLHIVLFEIPWRLEVAIDPRTRWRVVATDIGADHEHHD